MAATYQTSPASMNNGHGQGSTKNQGKQHGKVGCTLSLFGLEALCICLYIGSVGPILLTVAQAPAATAKDNRALSLEMDFWCRIAWSVAM
jgi:hypothetical protein